jgi:hypothetical protein
MDAWVHIRHEAEQEAPLSEPMRAFESHSAREIALLAEQLSAGSWAPHPVHRVDIPKDSGGLAVATAVLHLKFDSLSFLCPCR